MSDPATTMEQWSWLAAPEAERAPRLRRDLAQRGALVVEGGLAELSAIEASRAPWEVAARLLGERATLVERQPIKAVSGGKSFASSSGDTPLHTDSQLFAGVPPAVQIMICERAAERGGECVLVDGWALLDRVRAEDPALYEQLFARPRRIPFVFGDVFGPTVSLRGGRLVLTHSPLDLPRDPVAARLAPFIAAAPRIEIAIAPGEILVVHNHRMLHGRRAFAGADREFTRLLVWIDGELATHPEHRAVAAEAAARAAARLAGAPAAVLRRLGLAPAPPREEALRLAAVLAMLRGVPPGALAARERIPEPELYRMRDVALAAAARALAGADEAGDDAMTRALAALSGA